MFTINLSRLEKLMMAKGWNWSDLQKATRFSWSTINKIKKGQHITFGVASKLASVISSGEYDEELFGRVD